MSIHVVLIHEESLVRESLMKVLAQESDLVVEERLSPEVLGALKMDVLVAGPALDFALLRQVRPTLPILVLAGNLTAEDLRAMMQLGVAGVVSRSARLAELLEGIRSVASGQRYLCRQGNLALAAMLSKRPIKLTARERDLLRASSQGMSVRCTAMALRLSPKTVEKHRGTLLRKMNCGTMQAAVDRARECGAL